MRARITFSTVSGRSTGISRSKPVSVAPHQGARADERPNELLEIERVALGAGQEPALQLGGQRCGADQPCEQLRAGIAGQGLQRDLTGAMGQLAKGRLAQPPERMLALRASGEHEQDGVLFDQLEQAADECQAGSVSPVQIVQSEHQRPRVGGVGEGSRDGFADQSRRLLGGARGNPRIRDSENRFEERHMLRAGAIEALPDGGAKGPVGHRLAVGDAPPLEPSLLSADRVA
jgi:hypothetical protein